ncbi:MAG: ribonuclease E/G, partial [Alphaproteobacteria bacterium]|nr:ribonuclease E/G [Alphaproteobacteria bacterium]
KKMLIDATHAEETRVVVLDNGRVEELDVDTSTKKQLKGNIYLAKIVRVEPSLQAAFVDYGGNKHGFLAFSEIHPDYYQIPVADREALKELMDAHNEERQEEEKQADISSDTQEAEVDVETIGDAVEETPVRRPAFFKKYRIQEVIHQGQVMLVQVIKEERGNKGAALTTYLSLAGRFSVLMPNNGKGGGVSRKITNVKERKSLRTIVDKLPIPQGMSVIIRTAGAGKTKTEIKRDFDYLIKTWMRIRNDTLESLAPKLIHQEGDIIKRSLRDVFTADIEEIWIEGDKIFKSTKEFMKTLMPGQVKKIKQYKGAESLFQAYQVESQLEAVHSNIVQLKSGGYLVIDQTEALVAVDVNSGRSTKERDIEETALRTNLETCDELARQLKLRDMAGLIVIDFIDMDEPKNNAAVERRLKEALKKDRARIQVGKISGFGLMEMSRQRLHSSFLESSYKVCPHCGGKGVVRLVESCATRTMSVLEEAAAHQTGNTIVMSVPPAVAEYVLNQKRTNLMNLEQKYEVQIQILSDATLDKNSDYRLERLRSDGQRVNIQPCQPVRPVRMEKPKQRKENKKIEEVVADPICSTDVEDTQEIAPAIEEKISAKTARNRRRREWKRKKHAERMARLQARREAEAQEAFDGINGAHEEAHLENAVIVSEEHLPVVHETEHKVLVVPEEEHFTVVEQGRLEGKEKPRRGHRGRGRRKKEQSDEVSYNKSDAYEAKEIIQPTNDAPIAEQKVSDEETVSVAPKNRRGGWWNRLVK